MQEGTLIQCSQCNRKYKTTHTLKQHLEKIHNITDAVDISTMKLVQEKNAKPLKRTRVQDEIDAVRLEREKECLLIVRRARESPDVCAICFERESGTGAVVPCGHACFCFECLQGWGENKGCPMCRGPIEKIQLIRK